MRKLPERGMLAFAQMPDQFLSVVRPGVHRKRGDALIGKHAHGRDQPNAGVRAFSIKKVGRAEAGVVLVPLGAGHALPVEAETVILGGLDVREHTFVVRKFAPVLNRWRSPTPRLRAIPVRRTGSRVVARDSKKPGVSPRPTPTSYDLGRTPIVLYLHPLHLH